MGLRQSAGHARGAVIAIWSGGSDARASAACCGNIRGSRIAGAGDSGLAIACADVAGTNAAITCARSANACANSASTCATTGAGHQRGKTDGRLWRTDDVSVE